jgi:hypothetical protein
MDVYIYFKSKIMVCRTKQVERYLSEKQLLQNGGLNCHPQ